MSDCTCDAYYDGDLSVPHSVGCPMARRRDEEDRRVMQADFERGVYERADAEDHAEARTTTPRRDETRGTTSPVSRVASPGGES